MAKTKKTTKKSKAKAKKARQVKTAKASQPKTAKGKSTKGKAKPASKKAQAKKPAPKPEGKPGPKRQASLPERAEADLSQYEPEFLIELLRQMLLIRRFEEKSAQLYGLQKIGGFCHLYIGQEAVAVGSIAALDLAKDYVLTAYRDHGHALAVGMTCDSIMAELLGKATGCSRGKGGSMHMFDKDLHFLGGNGIVGAHIPVATGAALRCRYDETGGVVLCYFGDGAIHQGSFHESLNLAKIWDLPIIYICENNQYGMGTFFHRVSAVHDFSVMGASYDIPGVQVNGMDVLEVHREVSKAVERARTEHCPSLMEIRTYRYRGHSMSDPAKYRTREELDSFKQQDPILILRGQMEEAGLIDGDGVKAMDDEVKQQVDASVKFAEDSPEPSLESLYEDVLVESQS